MMILSWVVLPAPFQPTRPTFSPFLQSHEHPLSTSMPLNDFFKPSNLTPVVTVPLDRRLEGLASLAKMSRRCMGMGLPSSTSSSGAVQSIAASFSSSRRLSSSSAALMAALVAFSSAASSISSTSSSTSGSMSGSVAAAVAAAAAAAAALRHSSRCG